jgi:ATP-binding cassette subfamily B protein
MTFYDDEILGKAYDGRLVRRLMGFVLPYKWSLTAAIVLMIGSALVELIPPYLIRIAIDGPIANRDVAGIWPIFYMYTGTIVF